MVHATRLLAVLSHFNGNFIYGSHNPSIASRMEWVRGYDGQDIKVNGIL